MTKMGGVMWGRCLEAESSWDSTGELVGSEVWGRAQCCSVGEIFVFNACIFGTPNIVKKYKILEQYCGSNCNFFATNFVKKKCFFISFFLPTKVDNRE